MLSKSAALRLACLAFLISISAASWASQLFALPQSYKSGGWDAESIFVADVNRDGKPDLLVSNLVCHDSGCPGGQSGVSVLLGNGDGTFQASTLGQGTGGGLVVLRFVADVSGDAF